MINMRRGAGHRWRRRLLPAKWRSFARPFRILSNKDIVRHVERMSVEIDGDVQYRIDAGIALTSLPEGD